MKVRMLRLRALLRPWKLWEDGTPGGETMLLFLLTLVCTLSFCLFCGALSHDLRESVMMAYGLGSSLLPWTVVLVLAWRRGKGTQTMTGTRWLWMALFGLYITSAFVVTGAGTLYEALTYGIRWENNAVNWHPFSQGIDPVGYVLNVVLGVPLGFLVPLLWADWNRFGRMVGAGLAFSLLIELSQLCNFRATDVDDLIMNTLGTVLGFLLFRIFARVFHWRAEHALRWPLGPGLTVAVLFAGRFLLYRGIWMASLLYRF